MVKKIAEQFHDDFLIPEMRHIKRIHFVGIGGSGMSGIAEVLLNQGHYIITGSDICSSVITNHLEKLGARIFLGHKESHSAEADVVVVSSAVKATNPEVAAARAARIPVIPRAEMLAELMRYRYGIAVAGTHGKTTTTSLIASLLGFAGFDPTFVIGGRLKAIGSNAKLGRSRYFIAEADESDASFLHLQPVICVITNIDIDHMENYQGDFGRLQEAFIQFIHNLPFYGLVVLCIDDPVIKNILPKITRQVITYGFTQCCDYRAENLRQKGIQTFFTIRHKDSTTEISFNMPGDYNVQNALASFVVARELGVDRAVIKEGLKKFAGVDRRFQIQGVFTLNFGSVMLIDDYGHHPKEVESVIRAVRSSWPGRRLVMIYQPHRFTRTHNLFVDFVRVLAQVDVLLMLDIYAAGEAVIPGISSESLCQSIMEKSALIPMLVSKNQIQATLQKVLKDQDILITQGAGDIGILSSMLADSKLFAANI